jgi:hypothetical protein
MEIAKPFCLFLSITVLFAASIACGQQKPPAEMPSPERSTQGGMPGMDMGDMAPEADHTREAAKSANSVMADHDMKMGAHMFMTDLRPRNVVDDKRAAQIVEILGKSITKYRDYKVALGDGFRIFMPNLPQPLYHFTNYGYGYQAEFHFDPEHPTSLLYKKTADGYELVGAMYTAPKNSTDDQLDLRVPLSVARWHKHVNLCLPEKGASVQAVDWQKFGFEGSISTPHVCEQAGGRWFAEVFNWMVHVYPYQTDPAEVWAH